MTSSLWDYWGVSTIGPLHIQMGIPNQDAWMSDQFTWGNVVSIADGLGSKPHSDHGSKQACRAVLEAAKIYQRDDSIGVDNIAELIHTNWLAMISPLKPEDCSSTCLFVIQIDQQLILGRLGDGLIAVHGKSEEDSVILSDDKNNSFSNYTACLSQTIDRAQWEIIVLNEQQCMAVVLCTDGIADDLLPDKKNDFAKDIYLNYRDVDSYTRTKNIKKWLQEWPVPNHSDDKTIACLYKKEGDNE